MMNALRQTETYSLRQYLEIEAETQQRYEYHDGHIVAMAGGTLNHSLLCDRIFGELYRKLEGSQCTPFSGQTKLHIPVNNRYLYPDGMVICGDLVPSKTEVGAITNPVLIIEVLSKNTESYDRGGKFDLYRDLPSFKEYVLVHQNLARVERYQKTEEGLWVVDWITGLESILHLHTLSLEIPLSTLYKGLNFLESA